MPLWEVGLTSDGGGVHQDLKKLEFLALSDLVGHWQKLRKRWHAPESDGRRAVVYVKWTTLHTTWTNKPFPPIYLWSGRTAMKCRNRPNDRIAVRTTIPSPDRVKKKEDAMGWDPGE